MTNQIEYRKGDLFSYIPRHNTILSHGVNCQGVMGSGVAKTFKEKYPRAFKEYVGYVNSYSKTNELLGKVLFSKDSDNLTLACMFTQEFYGRDGKKYMSYEAFFDAFCAVVDCYDESTIVMPKIGAGLGGGDWGIIEGLMKVILENRPKINVIVFEL